MISRRVLLRRAAWAAAAAGAIFAVRDRLPWPPLDVRFADGRATPWQRLPPRPGVVELAVSVNGAPARAVIDSGAQISVVDAGLAARLGLPRVVAAPLLAFGVAGPPQLTHTVHLDLAAQGLAAPGLRAAVLDLAAVARASGRTFDLLIGRDVLRHVVLDADFPLGRARLMASGAWRPTPETMSIALESHFGAPVAPVRIEAAEPLRLLIDTGAAGEVALSDAAARRTGLLAPGRRVSQGHSISVTGLNPERLVTARSVQIGPLAMRNVDVQIYARGAGAPGPDGLVGAGLFHDFRLTLDLAARRLDLTRAPLIILPRDRERTP